MTMTLLASQVLGASAASVTFSSISQNYKTLRVIVSAREDANTLACYLLPNGSSTSLTSMALQGNGASAIEFTGTDIQGLVDGSTMTANSFSSVEYEIPNYAGTAAKAISIYAVTETNAATSYLRLAAGLWSNTAAITSITLQPAATENFVTDSSFYLYGLS